MPTVPDTHLWRSPLLGQRNYLDLACGRVEYFERGSGRPLVFAHGWLANANLWRGVVDRLADRFCCIALDLPLGAHRTPLSADADLTPAGVASIIRDCLDGLDLDRPTLVGNDSGGAYSQIATAADPQRIGALVLNACETPFDAFPPAPFDGLPTIAQDVRQLGELLQALKDPNLRRSEAAFGLLIKHPIAAEVFDSYVLTCVNDPGILRDVAKVIAATTPAAHHGAGRKLIQDLHAPVLLVWNREDRVFPATHGERYAAALPNGTFVPIDGSFAFTPEDAPAALARAISEFARGHD